MSIIVALSGGKASAWCANYVLTHYAKEEVVLYFNDTRWEHKDLYRFLDDLSIYFDHPIVFDSDGRSPKDETLESFRRRIELGQLSSYYDTDEKEVQLSFECIGICSTIA